MTIIEGLNVLKAQGVTKLVGMAEITDIDTYIDRVQSWTYDLDHEDDSHMVETADGHHIIVTTYDTTSDHPFNVATYSDYDTVDEMNAEFEEYQIQHEAEAIAANMDTIRPGELPHAAWVLIAASELEAAYKAFHEAFEREFAQA